MAKAKKEANEVIFNPDEFLNNVGLDNFNGPDDADLWADQYPYIQWNNSAKQWEFPLKHWAGSNIETDHELIEVDHGEETEHGFLLPEINVSIVAWRFTWEKLGEDGKMVYSAQPIFNNGEKWSKRYNFLCLVRETGDDDPAIITAKGYTGEFLYNALNQGRKRTLKLARKLTNKQFPGYLFWIPLAAGNKRVVGKEQKSAIYPPASMAYDIHELDQEGLANLLSALYIGDEFKGLIASYLFDEGQKWAVDIPQRPALSAGETEPKAEILPGGVLWLPDLSDKKRPQWIELALSIPDLFNERTHASNAFAKCLRDNGLGNASPARQWEAWRTELEKRFTEKAVADEAIETERMLAG